MTKEVFQLEVQVNTNPALTGLNSLDKKLKDVKDSSDKIGKGNPLGGLNSSVNTLSTSLKGLGSLVAGIAFGKLATEAFTAMAAFDGLQTTLTTITGSVTSAATAMQLLQSVSASTPFSVDQLGQSFIKLKAAGIEPTSSQLKLFADVASVTTDKVGALQAITDLYARTTAGGLGLEEVNRLADRGIPVFDILSKRIGVSRLQISELGKTAEGAQLILRNLEAGMSDQFGGAAAANMNTLNGQIDILKKNITNMFVGMGTAGATNGLKDLLAVLNETITAADGTTKSLGKGIGQALSSLATGINAVAGFFGTLIDGWNAADKFIKELPPLLNFIAVAASIALGGIVGGALRAGIVLEKLVGWFGAALKAMKALIVEYPKLAAIVGTVGTLMGIGAAVGPQQKSTILPDTGAGAGRGNAQGQLAAYRAKELDDAKKAQELLTGRDAIISKIVKNIEKETALIGLGKQKAEETNLILEAQAQIREKLAAGGANKGESDIDFQKRIDSESKKLVDEKAGSIRLAIAKKYSDELTYQMKLMRDNTSFEVSLLGQSSNEIEKQTKLRETLLSLGIKDTATTKQKQDILEQITLLQEGRITDSLSKNLKGIQLETEYLKLGNEEREKRIALDKAAADAGFKDAAELINKRPAEAERISGAIGAKVQTGIDVAGRDQIRDLKEEIDLLKKESSLLSLANNLDIEREKRKQAIYKAIDPEGRGKKINEAQQTEIEGLLKTIEEQEKLIEVNKKIDDAFATLGDAASNWALGTEGAIKRVRLALLQLATLAAFKYFAGGMPIGAAGSFLTGVLGGLSGARAEGGPVDAGKSYLVGEKRPEVFVPSTNGYIVPNTAMMNTSTGATHVTLSPNLIIQGSVTGQTELENMFDQFSSAMANETQKFVITQLGQNGILAR